MREHSFEDAGCAAGSHSSLVVSKQANKVFSKRLQNYGRVNSSQALPSLANSSGLKSLTTSLAEGSIQSVLNLD